MFDLGTILTTIFGIGIGIFILTYLVQCFTIVGQTEQHVIETLGTYSKTVENGWYFLLAPFQRRVANLSTKIATTHDNVMVKTKDSQFVGLPITVLTKVEDAFKAHYSLEHAKETIGAMVLNIIRPTAAGLTLDELFSDRSHLLGEVKGKLAHSLADYGYALKDLLIDQPALSSEAQQAFNAVLLAQKRQQAAVSEAEAARIKIEAEANAEAESQRLRAQGLADARSILAASLKSSIEDLAGVAPQEAIHLLLETNRIDALRTMAKESNNLIIVDSNKVGSIMVQAPNQEMRR